MNLISIFFISFVIALSGALMPGPFLAAVISESAKQGFKSGPIMILGHALAEIIMIILIVLGLAKFIYTPWILKLISFLGAGILIFFGINMILSLPGVSLNFNKTDPKPSRLIITGITMSVGNPYWSIWWLTIGLSLVLGAQKAGTTAIIVFFTGHILADLIWYSMVSFAISKGRNLIQLKTYKKIIFICAITLICFGIYFSITPFK